MIVLHVRDRGHAGVQDVRGIQPSAEAHLDQCQVDPRVGEVREGGGGEGFELGWWSQARADSLDRRRHRLERGGELLAADRAAIDGDPLAVADEVRLRHRPDPLSRLLEHGPRQGDDAALAVGAADQCSPQASLGMAELVEERLDALQAEADAEASAAAQGGHRAVVVQAGGQAQAPSSS